MKINGEVEVKISRSNPPPTPVKTPSITDINGFAERPCVKASSVPITVNAASPMESKILFTFSTLSRTESNCLRYKYATANTPIAVNAAIPTIYALEKIAGGVAPIKISRVIPPPTAVIQPITITPNISKKALQI